MNEMITRQQVTSGEIIYVWTDPTACIGSHPNRRLFIDSFTMAGIDLDKNIVAIEGGEDVTKADSATAAASVIRLSITPGSINPTISITLGALIKSNTRTLLESAVSSILQAGATDMKIKLGNSNKKQEYKTDDAWGIMIDISNLELYPISAEAFSIKIEPTELMGVAKDGMRYHVVSIDGLTTSQGSLPVCCAASTDKGVVRIGYIAAV
ncbi:intracellular growth locus C protein [Francisella noatunensis]|uniref:Intracellular growth locus C protein n=1 Tax=Francisella noatunensis TaxID=657445 RepID=A0A9Q2QG25_9GAMM|nr:type VI secretion system tube protein IglC [Francisella noatunensis]MBK2029431.1 intracellular growth locus C protein [Francisella noatunensis]MBK2034754.1 intracellular growth locus C protein [Francisella noatunensis]MBK2050844.1 intracellular growth locus C protein [Francisella noatunensis]MBK2052267.1 intracellular growth locus C protein [Francisella noatunensis]MBK2055217.1 intracellular growth locus C protein [Francisella noatunensis]